MDLHGLAHCHHLLPADGTRPSREKKNKFYFDPEPLQLPSVAVHTGGHVHQ